MAAENPPTRSTALAACCAAVREPDAPKASLASAAVKCCCSMGKAQFWLLASQLSVCEGPAEHPPRAASKSAQFTSRCCSHRAKQ